MCYKGQRSVLVHGHGYHVPSNIRVLCLVSGVHVLNSMYLTHAHTFVPGSVTHVASTGLCII